MICWIQVDDVDRSFESRQELSKREKKMIGRKEKQENGRMKRRDREIRRGSTKEENECQDSE